MSVGSPVRGDAAPLQSRHACDDVIVLHVPLLLQNLKNILCLTCQGLYMSAGVDCVPDVAGSI